MRTKFVYFALSILLLPLSVSALNPQSTAVSIPFNSAQYTQGPFGFSLPIFEGRSHENVLSRLQREARAGMKSDCNFSQIAPVNGRLRRLRFTYRVESLDIAISRNSASFAGTANVTYSCVLRTAGPT